jgi:hypothetical protein
MASASTAAARSSHDHFAGASLDVVLGGDRRRSSGSDSGKLQPAGAAAASGLKDEASMNWMASLRSSSSGSSSGGGSKKAVR